MVHGFAGTGLIAAVSFVLINLQTRKLMNQLTGLRMKK